MTQVLAEAFGQLAAAAAIPVLRIYEAGFEARAKADGSLVTQADLAAEEVILAGLARVAKNIPIVAEEACAAQGFPAVPDRFILVDALDGTREFVQRNGEFTINIALIERGAPVCGAVYAPVSRRLWIGSVVGAEAMSLCPGEPLASASARRGVRVRQAPAQGLVCLVSRSHLDAQTRDYVAKLPLAELVAAGSSVKFCLIAEGAADIYPRFSPTMEWDTAAGDAVLRAAGGRVETFLGTALAYGKQGQSFSNPPFLARGG
jgi:3'(2'), 5'-bisphosphate nucleotidase